MLKSGLSALGHHRVYFRETFKIILKYLSRTAGDNQEGVREGRLQLAQALAHILNIPSANT